MDDDLDQGQADRLAMARTLHGAYTNSASQAARAMGIPEPTYHSHENGSRGISAKAAMRYAEFYSIDLTWLITGKGEPREDNPIDGLATVTGMVRSIGLNERHRFRKACIGLIEEIKETHPEWAEACDFIGDRILILQKEGPFRHA